MDTGKMLDAATRHQPPAPLRSGLRDEFLLARDLTFLNHGSFGATPRVVFDEHVQWQRRIENDPIQMLGRQGMELIDNAKEAIGRWLGMRPADFGMVTNATEGINAVLRSLSFEPGDELLTTTHVYNAVRQAMKYTAARARADYREIDLPVPIDSPATIARTSLDAIGPRTRLLVIDHVTSPTALVFPVEEIVRGCAGRGVDVLIDGAHGPGMLEINVTQLSPAYYAGNLHKWTCAPKGSAFIWVRPDRQNAIHPTIVSHHLGKGLATEFSWQGTRDIGAWLSVPRAIEFIGGLGFDRVMSHNHSMAVWMNEMLCRRWGVQPISPIDGSMLGSMATVPLPPPLDRLTDERTDPLQRRLHDTERIEAPIMNWAGRTYVRPCCQVYNTAQEYGQLADAIDRIAQEGF
jgi:isopenicillin-N epimerase